MLGNLANTIGSGIFLAGGAIFFIHSAGLSVSQLSVGLTVAGSVALLVSLPIGLLTDLVGPREVAIVMLGLRALATAGFVMVHSLPALILAGSVALSGDRGGQVAFAALIAGIGSENRVRLRSYMRAVTNFGVSVGACGSRSSHRLQFPTGIRRANARERSDCSFRWCGVAADTAALSGIASA